MTVATKLTLRLDETLVNEAKKTARNSGLSLSRIVEDYFRSLVSQGKKKSPESPVLSEVAGILSSEADAGKALAGYKKHLTEKYR
jgi:hypothetical protein